MSNKLLDFLYGPATNWVQRRAVKKHLKTLRKQRESIDKLGWLLSLKYSWRHFGTLDITAEEEAEYLATIPELIRVGNIIDMIDDARMEMISLRNDLNIEENNV